jgi:hypothetical protein
MAAAWDETMEVLTTRYGPGTKPPLDRNPLDRDPQWPALD